MVAKCARITVEVRVRDLLAYRAADVPRIRFLS
jgi:hypothetical protein